jgi:hypothetical protein
MDPDQICVVNFTIGGRRGVGVWYWPSWHGTGPSASYRIFWL